MGKILLSSFTNKHAVWNQSTIQQHKLYCYNSDMHFSVLLILFNRQGVVFHEMWMHPCLPFCLMTMYQAKQFWWCLWTICLPNLEVTLFLSQRSKPCIWGSCHNHNIINQEIKMAKSTTPNKIDFIYSKGIKMLVPNCYRQWSKLTFFIIPKI